MKKLLLCLMLLLSSLCFAVEYPSYVTDVKKVEYEEADYKCKVELEAMFTQDGTLGNAVFRISLALQRMQEEFPNAKWLFFKAHIGGNEIWSGSIKVKDLDLQNKKDVELVKTVVRNWNINMAMEDREKVNQFIEEGYIPKM